MRPTNDRISGMGRPSREGDPAGPRPDWLKVPIQTNTKLSELKKLVGAEGLHTVCQSASCPNIGDCWSRGAITFMILGAVCTRSCGFCDVATGRPESVDTDEPERLARSLGRLKLRYAVITSVDRDDLEDGGAGAWAETIRQIKAHCPRLKIEALTPDFRGELDSVGTVIEAEPHVFAHNLETVESLHRLVRPQAKYERSLAVLEQAKKLGAVTKSGVMLGLGEDDGEVLAVLRDIRAVGVDIVSIGQYMRPSRRHLPVRRWVHPETFADLEQEARSMGFEGVMSAPLVRSSYRADEQAGLGE